MLAPIKRFIGIPILSLQTGSELAKTSDVIIDPRKLKVVALRVSGNRLDHTESVLHPEDIREISDLGIIVDNSDQLMSTEGLVRLQEIIDFGFVLEGVHIEDDQHRKLGTVKDYAIDPESFFVQQLYIQPPFVRSLSITALVVHRSQIISVTNRKIIVKSDAVKEKVSEKTAATSLVNPFRAPVPTQPETKDL